MSVNLDAVRQKIIERKQAEEAALRRSEEKRLEAEEEARRKQAEREAEARAARAARIERNSRTTERVVLEVKEVRPIHPDDPSSNAVELVGHVRTPLKGVAVTPDEQGRSKEEVRVGLRLGGKAFGLKQLGPGGSRPLRSGSTVLLSGAVFDPDTGHITATLTSRLNDGTGHDSTFISYPVTIDPPYRPRGSETWFQRTRVLMPDDARTFGNLEEFAKLAEEMLSDDMGGLARVTVRCFRKDNPVDVMTWSISQERNEDWTYKNPAEVITKALMEPRMETFVRNVDQFGSDENYFFEIIPSHGYRSIHTAQTGTSGILRLEARSAEYKGVGEGDRQFTGYADGVMTVRQLEDSMHTPSTAVERLDPNGPIYPLEEVITHNLPAQVASLYNERAEQRANAAWKQKVAEARAVIGNPLATIVVTEPQQDPYSAPVLG